MITIDNDGRKDGDMFLRDHEVAYYDGTGNHWKQTNGYKSMTLEGVPTRIDDLFNIGSMSVYPNPAIESVKVKTEKVMESLTIYNAMGQKVKHFESVKSSQFTIPVNDLDNGVYVIEGTDNNGDKTISRFMKM